MQITDSSSGRSAAVTKNNELLVTTASAIHAATLRGDAYAWNAISADLAATETALLVSNQSDTRLLVMHKCIIRGDLDTGLDFQVSDTTGLTLTGTAVVAVNLNRKSSKKPDALAYVDETGCTTGSIVLTIFQNESKDGQTTTTPMYTVDLKDAVILGKNDAFKVDVVANTAAAFECTFIGYYIDA